MKKNKKHYKKEKIFGVKITKVSQSKPLEERLVTAKPTVVFKDKSKYNKTIERRKNKVR